MYTHTHTGKIFYIIFYQIYTYIYVCVYMRVYMCMHACTHMCVCVCIYMYIQCLMLIYHSFHLCRSNQKYIQTKAVQCWWGYLMILFNLGSKNRRLFKIKLILFFQVEIFIFITYRIWYRKMFFLNTVISLFLLKLFCDILNFVTILFNIKYEIFIHK